MAAFLKILKGPPLQEDQLHGASGHRARALSLQRLQRAAAFGALVVRDLLYGLGLLALFGRRRGKPPRMSGFPVGFPLNPTWDWWFSSWFPCKPHQKEVPTRRKFEWSDWQGTMGLPLKSCNLVVVACTETAAFGASTNGMKGLQGLGYKPWFTWAMPLHLTCMTDPWLERPNSF